MGLFDDKIEPTSVGLADVSAPPRTDPVLRSRSQQAEAVARARVATVTVDTTHGAPQYRVNLSIIEPLATRGFTDGRVELVVEEGAPAFGIVKWLDTRLIGRTFMLFLHRFAGQAEPELRFHLAPDTPEVIAAVRDANTLGALR